MVKKPELAEATASPSNYHHSISRWASNPLANVRAGLTASLKGFELSVRIGQAVLQTSSKVAFYQQEPAHKKSERLLVEQALRSCEARPVQHVSRCLRADLLVNTTFQESIGI